MLLGKLLVNSRLLGVKVLGESEVMYRFSTERGLVPLAPVLFKAQL